MGLWWWHWCPHKKRERQRSPRAGTKGRSCEAQRQRGPSTCQETGPRQGPNLWHLDLGPSLQNSEKCLLFKAPVYGILLQQPQLTKTPTQATRHLLCHLPGSVALNFLKKEPWAWESKANACWITLPSWGLGESPLESCRQVVTRVTGPHLHVTS